MLNAISIRTIAASTSVSVSAKSSNLRNRLVLSSLRTSSTNIPRDAPKTSPSIYKAWRPRSTSENNTTIPTVPLHKLQGRTVPVAVRGIGGLPTGDVLGAFRRLEALLRRNNVRKEVKLNRFYEKPSTKRKRLKMEQNRKLFGDLVKRKLRLVMEMKSRGM